jgi:lipase chaperone LimK
MLQRGRKSTDARAAALMAADGARPEPPSELSQDEARIWREIVARLPSNWFPRETHALLTQYCRHEATLKDLTNLINKLKRASNLPELRKMLRERRLESKTIAMLAVKMRLSQQSTYDRTVAFAVKRKASTETPSVAMWT